MARQRGSARLLTFGSVAAGAHLPYYPALYRVAIEALAPLAIRILVTVGDAEREIEELGEVRLNVHVETWIPHDDVARRADAIVCHGGFGSTLGALAHGALLVVVPLFSNGRSPSGQPHISAVFCCGLPLPADAAAFTRKR